MYNVCNLTVQLLEVYFEHDSSHGGPVHNVDFHKEDDYAIVTFENYTGNFTLIQMTLKAFIDR